jgi:dihydropteroate synthase
MQTCTIGGVVVGGDAPRRIMGVINCSPESFFQSSYVPAGSIRNRAFEIIDEGADMIDIGARSTAPGSPPISVDQERKRVKQALGELQGTGIPVTLDTMYPEILEAALKYDIAALNDISGLANEKLAQCSASAGLPVIAMASFKRPGDSAGFEQTVEALWLILERAEKAGIEEIVLDPGIGRWTPDRSADIDWALCMDFHRFTEIGYPVMAAISRKSFIGEFLGRETEDRLAGSIAATYYLLRQGAAMIRTHDIAATIDLVRVFERLERER